MVSIYIVIFFLTWFVSNLAQVLNWIYWIQIKEYRFDRFKVLLKSNQGIRSLSLPLHILKISILLFITLFRIPPIVALIIFIINDLFIFFEVFNHKIRIPIYTQRIRNIFLTTVPVYILVGFLVWQFPGSIILWILFGEMLVISAVILGLFWTKILVNNARANDISQAKEKLRKINPFVIGVTGSYGKSTTKEFIADLLSQKYHVLKTPENKNTDFGVARTIIQDLKDGTDIFVAEMGAYKIGEIQTIAQMVSPKIGIITGIEPQHLEIFGSLENIKKAKYELIESLPKGGISIFNYSNLDAREMAEWAIKDKKTKVYGYRVSDSKESGDADIYSRVISANESGIKFEVNFQNKKVIMTAPVTGTHFIENLTCAILVARIKGMSWPEINKKIKDISVSRKTMNVYRKDRNTIVVDNSYNNNPHGFEASLKYLKLFKDYKRIIITSGIIELGNETFPVHQRLGQLMAKDIDKIFLTNSDFYEPLKSGLSDEQGKLFIMNNENDFEKQVKKFIGKKVIILIQGRIPEKLKKIIEKI